MLSLVVFLALVFWQYWQTRIPLEATPRYYYQYCPIRTFFPSLAFFLIVLFQTGTSNIKRILLPVLSLTSSFAIFWNLDTGIVVFGATFIALLFSTLDSQSLKDAMRRSLVYAAYMIGSLTFVIILFLVTTKIKSGVWPDFRHFSEFQNLFYISGIFMLPMSAIHFWNLPAVVYLIACVYCVYYIRKTNQQDAPVLAFLFILGFGIFAYFQGRSYDLTLNAVMYPSIIILGIFCNNLFSFIIVHKLRFHESVLLFFIPFLFLADGAFSMLYHTPSLNRYSLDNAFVKHPEKEKALKQRMDFVTNNIPRKDTVLILAKDYESYYYAAGQYYNPLKIAGSTEMFFKSELLALLDLITTTKYPILFDATHSLWPGSDTLMSTLNKYTTIVKEIGPDHSFILLKPGKKPLPDKLIQDASTIYYNDLGDFARYVTYSSKLNLNENFTVELTVSLDSTRLVTDNVLCTNNSRTTPNTGLRIMQSGTDLTQYVFQYGNGNTWEGPACKLSCTTENHLLMKVEKNLINVYNNNTLCGTGNTNSIVKNGDGIFFIYPFFAGTVHELKISNQ